MMSLATRTPESHFNTRTNALILCIRLDSKNRSQLDPRERFPPKVILTSSRQINKLNTSNQLTLHLEKINTHLPGRATSWTSRETFSQLIARPGVRWRPAGRLAKHSLMLTLTIAIVSIDLNLILIRVTENNFRQTKPNVTQIKLKSDVTVRRFKMKRRWLKTSRERMIKQKLKIRLFIHSSPTISAPLILRLGPGVRLDPPRLSPASRFQIKMRCQDFS